jgi:hypothetical protein
MRNPACSPAWYRSLSACVCFIPRSPHPLRCPSPVHILKMRALNSSVKSIFSKIDLATVGLQYTHVHDVHTATVCTRTSQTTQYKTKQWQSARHCNAYIRCVHLGGIVLEYNSSKCTSNAHYNMLCHLGVSLLNHLQNKPSHFLINTM